MKQPLPTPHVIDLEATMQRLEGNRQLLQALVAFCYEDAPGLLRCVGQSINRHEPEEVARAAHSLKGLASNFGAQGVMAAAERIEESAVGGDWKAAEAVVGTLERETKRLLKALAPYRPKSPDKSLGAS